MTGKVQHVDKDLVFVLVGWLYYSLNLEKCKKKKKSFLSFIHLNTRVTVKNTNKSYGNFQ